MATREELDERRVKEAHKKWKAGRDKLEAFMVKHKDVFDEFYEQAEITNQLRKRFEQACRETGVGCGPVSVVPKRHVEYDVEFLEGLFAKDSAVLRDLIVVKKTVQGKVFDNLVADKRMTPAQVQKAVLASEKRFTLNGVPTEIVLP